MKRSLNLKRIRHRMARWLRQGISPRRLALTLALGFAVGCIPVVGIPTVLCAGLALALRLNLPAIQAANYAAMPLQLVLIAPFIRLGEKIFAAPPAVAQTVALTSLPHLSALTVLTQLSGLAGHALVAWLIIAPPAVLLMTAMLTVMLRRIPAMAAAEAAD
jgi:uncharacterized protein (DUF2062 family)